MNIHQMYGLLLAGKKVSITLPSKKEITTLRVLLAKYKKTQEDALVATELLEEKDIQRLNTTMEAQLPPAHGIKVTFQFSDRIRQYDVIVEKDDDDENSITVEQSELGDGDKAT